MIIGKHVVDFLLVLIELFFAGCYGWGATSEYRFKIGDFAPTGAGWPKISGRRGRPTNHSSSQKTRLNDLLYGVKMWADLSSVLSQSTRLKDGETDGRTDGHTAFSSLDRVCIACIAVKIATRLAFPILLKCRTLAHFLLLIHRSHKMVKIHFR